MKTMGEAVIEQAKEERNSGTEDGMRLLGLKDTPENYYAGNMYSVALAIIRKLLEEKGEIK